MDKFCKHTKCQNPNKEGMEQFQKSEWKLQTQNSTPTGDGRKDGCPL